MKIELISGATAYEAGIHTIEKINSNDFSTKNLVVVPDSFSMQAESLIFDVLKISSTFNIEVVGISRLASKILRNQNIPFQRISALEEIFNIYKAVSICQNQFCYFQKCNVDFCIKILQIIKQFKACKIKPEQIKEVGDVFLDRKMKDLKLIYQTYEQLLGDKLDLSKLLEFFVENTNEKLDLQNVKLFFVNFDSFSTEINSFICRLASYVNEVYIGFSRPIAEGNAFIFEDDILEKTKKFAKENKINVQVENSPTIFSGDRLNVIKNVFAFCVEKHESDYFQNIIAKNKKDEIEFVAKYIKNAIFNGQEFKNFAVAVPDEAYLDELKTIFDEYEIAFYSDDSTNLSQTILGRFLIDMLNISKSNFKKETAKFLVSSPLLKVDETSKILTEIDFYDIQDKKEFIERYPQFKTILDKIEKLSLAKFMKDYLLEIKEILEIVDQKYQILLSSLENKGIFKKESENKQAKELILKVIDKLLELGADETFSIEDFFNLFVLSLESIKVETVPAYIDAVYVGNATTSYFEDVDFLFVLGATANNLPKTQNDIEIIDDEDIKKLSLNFALEPEIKVINRRNRLKIFELLQHAKEKLFVSTPISDDEKLAQKASFVFDLLNIFGEKNIIHTASLEDFEIGVLSEDDAIDKFLFYVGNLKSFSANYYKLKLENKIPLKWMKNIEGTFSAKISSDKEKLQLSNYTIKKINKNKISASELETYFACPYRRLLRYSLAVQPKENIEPNKRLFGVFEHLLLKTFIESFNRQIMNLDDYQIEEFLNKNVKRIAEKVYDKKIIEKKYFVKFLFNESKIILKNAVFEQKNSDFRPLLLEEKVVDKIFDHHNLVGFVDRVDSTGKYFRVIDYKTGKTDGIKKDLYYGKKLQLLLYAKAIKDKLGLDCAGVYYFDCKTKFSKQNQNFTLLNGLTLRENDVVESTDKRLMQDNLRSNIIGMTRKKNANENEFSFKNGNAVASLKNFEDYAVKVSQQALNEIAAGYAEAKPLKEECKFCPYLSICRHRETDGYRVMKTVSDDNLKG